MMIRGRFLHALPAALAVALALCSEPRARIDAVDGTSFVRDVGAELLAIGGAERRDAAARERRLRTLYRARFHADAIAARVAGRAWHGAAPELRATFARSLERFIVKALDVRLAGLTDARFEVLMSEPEADGLVVYSRLLERERARFVNVNWRLVKDGYNFRIRDLVVENLSLTLHLRQRLQPRQRAGEHPLEASTRALEALMASEE